MVGDLATEDLASAITHPRDPEDESHLGGTTLVGAYPPAAAMVPEAQHLKLRRRQQDPQTLPPVTPDDHGRYAGWI